MVTAALFACLLSTSAFAPAPELALYVEQQAKANGVPLQIAEAIIWQESGWNPFAVRHNPNGTTDQGLWQLNTRTSRWLAKRYNGGVAINAFDPYVSTRIALKYLGDLYSVSASWKVALYMYNAGLGAVLSRAIPASTVWYAQQIQERMSL